MKARIAIKMILFSAILVILIGVLGEIFIPKWTYDVASGDGPGYTDRIADFYDQEVDTIDVLLLGPSTELSSILPIELYKEHGITSYSLGGGAQTLSTSYYLLKESCEYQHLKCVVLDVSGLTYDDLDSNESMLNYKMAVQMRSIINRFSAIEASKQGTDSVLNWGSPLIKFHERWSDLNRADFQFTDFSDKYPSYYKGSFINTEVNPYWGLKLNQATVDIIKTDDFGGHWNSDAADRQLIEDNSVKNISEEWSIYFDLIYQFCEDNDIKLVCLKGPEMTGWPLSSHEVIENYLRGYGLGFIDYNYGDSKVEFDWSRDTGDHGYHVNYFGALKATHALGEYLSARGELADHRGDEAYAAWDQAVSEYDAVMWEKLSTGDEKAYRYLEELTGHLNEDQVVLIAVMDDVSDGWNETYEKYMTALGLSTNLYDNYRCSYIAVIEDGNPIYERNGDRLLVYRDAIYDRNGTAHKVELISAGMGQGNYCNIKIDNVEYAHRTKGLNIVVYNKASQTVESRVAIDTFGTGYFLKKI